MHFMWVRFAGTDGYGCPVLKALLPTDVRILINAVFKGFPNGGKLLVLQPIVFGMELGGDVCGNVSIHDGCKVGLLHRGAMSLSNKHTRKKRESDKNAISSRTLDSGCGITVAKSGQVCKLFSASDLGERSAALVRQAIFLEAARGLVGNRLFNQPDAPNFLTENRQIT